MMTNEFKKDHLQVKIYNSRSEMGRNAAEDAACYLKMLLSSKEEVNVIFAAAPSQNEFLEALSLAEIDWGRVNAFHMDEYIGLDPAAPQGFGNFLRKAIFDKVPFKSVHYIENGEDTSEKTCRRYTDLLEKYKTDVVFMGIGENGHIAFNDPHVADFNDEKSVKIVSLDEKCRMQQVHDGCFESIDHVPTHAITITIPALMSAERKFCIVPASTKAKAVYDTINGDIREKCPATVLRVSGGATLYLDDESSSLLKLN